MTPIHQSEHHVYRYKRQPPAPKCEKDLQLMMLAGGLLHGACIAHEVGWWDTVTFVPSANRPGRDHPSARLARQIASRRDSARRILLDIGPGYADEPPRLPRRDRSQLQPQYVSAVVGKHVLVVDDTWGSGDKAQSAALALKSAGASTVTMLCAARWLRHDWADHRELIETLREPLDSFQSGTDSDPRPKR
jgi:hypothetical protein